MFIDKLVYYAIALEAVIALFYAYKSWREHKFSAWTFIPMFLLIEAPHFIFPIFLTSEKNAVKKAGGDVEYSKTKLIMGWSVVLYYILMFIIMLAILINSTGLDKEYLVKMVALTSHILIILYIIILFAFMDKVAHNRNK